MDKYEDVKKYYRNVFTEYENGMNGESKTPVHQLRREAISKFDELQFPTQRDEEWKYTNISPVLKQNFKRPEKLVAVDEKKVAAYLFPREDYITLVFVNGFFNEALSDSPDEKGLTLMNMKKALQEDSELILKHISKTAVEHTIFAALSTAFIEEGIFLHVKPGALIEKPVQVLHYNTEKEALVNPRNLVVVGENAQVKLIETYAGTGGEVYLTNMVTEVVVDKHAVVNHIKIQREDESAFHISTTDVQIAGQANYTHYNVNLGGRLVRNDINATFNGEHAECSFQGVNLTDNAQLVDNHTMIDHAVPNCESHELYKSVLDDKSRVVFNGKVMVRQDAQKTNAFQENKNILLSDLAQVDTKPQLEIFADDVKCSHGATIGQLDEDALFYLKSRGFPADIAMATLIYAFASDVVHSIRPELVRDYLEEVIAEKLKK